MHVIYNWPFFLHATCYMLLLLLLLLLPAILVMRVWLTVSGMQRMEQCVLFDNIVYDTLCAAATAIRGTNAHTFSQTFLPSALEVGWLSVFVHKRVCRTSRLRY